MVTITPILFFFAATASVETKLPLTVSARAYRWLGDWLPGEKAIWNSGKHTRRAFLPAASLIKSIDFFRFSRLFSDECIWTTAIFLNSVKKMLKIKIVCYVRAACQIGTSSP